MARGLTALGAALALAALGQAAESGTNQAPARLDYSSFRIINERNIFNSARSSQRTGSREARRATRVDSVTLVGTLDYEKGRLAFFDGTSSEYRKALKLDASIAGYKLAGITHAGVKLVSGTNAVDLKVGMGLRREDEGDWHVVQRGEGSPAGGGGDTSSGFAASNRPGSSSSASASSSAGEASSSGSNGGASDVLKRMMERRAKEEQ